MLQGMDRLRAFLFSIAYLALALSGLVSLFTPTVLDQTVARNLIITWQCFLFVGGLICALAIYTKFRWELFGLPLLVVGLLLYAVVLINYALDIGRGWGVALILVGVTINLARRWISVYGSHSRTEALRDR